MFEHVDEEGDMSMWIEQRKRDKSKCMRQGWRERREKERTRESVRERESMSIFMKEREGEIERHSKKRESL